MSAALFTQIFLILLTGTVLTRLWLARRHDLHVLEHLRQVPGPFRGKILLKAHRKAADYTVSKTRFAMLAGVVDTLLLLGWTLGGGLEILDQTWRAAGFAGWFRHAVP
jgi:STE24 endopeptidase